ncbi:hypothetical protein EZS27_032497 [termite gut metagenome]|uniref:ISXO2-like transposase domain-containing protein n=1 Tax=termite gut metagenome TaxID=433724 RepID=A0A5J4Q6P0_9ZZZZ
MEFEKWCSKTQPKQITRICNLTENIYHIKMQIINDMKADTVTNIAKEQVDSQAELITDDSTPYKKLGEHVKSHDAQVVKPEDLTKMLPWVHIAIGNLKKKSIYHIISMSSVIIQPPLFREKLFDRLVTVAVSYTTDFKSKIYNRMLCGS